MGGQIAITMLLNDPSLAEKLVLCAPAGFEVFSDWDAALFETSIGVFDYFSTEENSLIKTIRNSFFNYQSHADEMIHDLIGLLSRYPVTEYRKMMKACVHGMLHEPVYDKLHLITHP